jgi:DNA-binding NarL/FixJ family response regulator
MYKIILTDDHRIFRQGLKSLIETEKLGNIIAEAENGKELLNLLSKHNPDLVLMDIDMPEMNGIEATIEALKINPALKILCLTTHGDEAHYYSAIDAGAKGFVLKTASINELHAAIYEVAAGGNYISVELLKNIIAKVNKEPTNNELGKSFQEKLTEQEIEVLLCLSKGISNAEIAEQLTLGVDEIELRKSNLLNKTNSQNTAGLIMYAIKNKIIVVN